MRVFLLCLVALMALVGCDSDEATPGTDTVTDTTSADTNVADTSQDVAVDTDSPDTVAPETTADTAVPETTADTVETETIADTVAPETTADTTETETTPDTVVSNGACDNSADAARFVAIESTLESKIQTCVFECLGQGSTCAATCVERETELSAGCSGCFGEVIACTIANCALQCINASSPGCTTCRDTNCTPAFETCAGIQQP